MRTTVRKSPLSVGEDYSTRLSNKSNVLDVAGKFFTTSGLRPPVAKFAYFSALAIALEGGDQLTISGTT